MPTFKNLKDLMVKFQDEQGCRDYLVQHRWGGKPICPYCGSDKSYRIENGKRFKCGNKECHKKYSVTVGTVAEDSNIPLSTWFAAIYIITSHKKGISSIQLGKDLGIPQKTAWFLLHRIREALREKGTLLLTKEVQADETYIGGLELNKHASKRVGKEEAAELKTAVVGLQETGGKIVTKATQWVTKTVVTNMILDHVEKPSTLVTDAASVYRKVGKKYNHVVVNHTEGEYVQNGYHINGLENYWSILKRGIYGIYHQVSRKHLQRYCDEFSFRFNSRKIGESERFGLTLCRLEGHMPYKTLIAKQKDHGIGKEIEETPEE
ncbi:IS1595 family transposase [Puia dinghuensis]|uniref:DDE transposase n=1 Tax=Puia dinghuensis TaxID=1792502 RepID=A0A8J2XUT7_9BACT|nr:IS1595 family transposase [Puia dinghuensis]GGB12200.1 DDE transposase [Puia dinghuensis]